MHYTTYAAILAAGSSVASAAVYSREAAIFGGGDMKGLLASRVRKGPPVKPVTPAPKNNPPPPKAEPPKADPPKPVSAADRAVMDQADRAAVMMVEYRKKYKELSPKDLGNNEPPPPNFNLGNNYYGNVNDYSQKNTNIDNSMNDARTQIGNGANTAGMVVNQSRVGATTKSTSQVDQSMNDNRNQIGNGANAAGMVTNNNRNGPIAQAPKTKRDVADTYSITEDGKVTFRDFKLLIKAMRRDPEIKNEAIYEIAGVGGLRPIVEKLIRTHTETDGQLTMNNFAALVTAMGQDTEVEQAVVDAFNSDMVYAFLVEKLLTRYYKDHQKELARRYIIEQYHGLNVRDLEERENFLARRDVSDEDFWLGRRQAAAPAPAKPSAPPPNDLPAVAEAEKYLQGFMGKYGLGCNPCVSEPDGSIYLNWASKSGPAIFQVRFQPKGKKSPPKAVTDAMAKSHPQSQSPPASPPKQ